MSSVFTEYTQVWEQVRQWPTDLRKNLADEIIQSLATVQSAPEGEWNETKNARRVQLIDKEIQATLTAAEAVELEVLQKQVEAYRDRVAPIPLEGARTLHQRLLEKAKRSKG